MEVKEKKDRVEDALSATRAAMEEGIVAGGGATYVHISNVVKQLKGDNDAQNAGIMIVYKALLAPLKQIAENAGLDGSVIVNNILNNSDVKYGFDAQNEEYGDMFKFGIVDPAKVSRVALEGAGSIVGLLITSECAIFSKPEKKCDCGSGSGGGNPYGGGSMEDFM